MSKIAAEADRKSLIGCAMLSETALHGARDPEINASIWHLRELRQDAVWPSEGFIDIPQRTRSTNP